MLLQRGHGSILSGFFKGFSCELLDSLCSSSLFEGFKVALSFSTGSVLEFSLIAEVTSGFVNSSEDTGGPGPSSLFSDGFSPKTS